MHTTEPAASHKQVAIPLAATARSSPPRAPFAFRVGVVGHRPNRLAAANPEQLASVLQAILTLVRQEIEAAQQRHRQWFDDSPPTLRAVSPLAEGTDRIFAEQALRSGYELCCVMPFPQPVFEQDFLPPAALEPDSLSRFRDLVGRATSKFELDGLRDQEDAAYGAGGRTVLHQSDLLVVVWDGERQGKRGGTEETLDDARRLGVPVVWVDAHAPHHWQVLDAAFPMPTAPTGSRLAPQQSDDQEALVRMIRSAVELPHGASRPSPTGHAAAAEDPAAGLKRFYDERQPRCTPAVLWKAFRDLLGDGRMPRVKFRVAPFEEAVREEWLADVEPRVAPMAQRMLPFYAWPDQLAVLYSDRYRSAYLLAYLLAAFAVGMALLPFGTGMSAHDLPELTCIFLELAAIVVILLLVGGGNLARWHERWIDYRLAAELVRHWLLVAPLGGGRPFPQIPAHCATYGQPGASWMAWYVRAAERALGLPSVALNKDYVDACLAHLNRLVKDQAKFHETTARRCRRIESSLFWCGLSLVGATLGCCLFHLLPGIFHDVHYPHALPPLLTFACGFFPALGAALAGINNQGEFRRIEKRAESMHGQLALLEGEISRLRARLGSTADPPPEQFSQQAAALASDAARLLVSEVLDWRIVFLDRPLHPPS